MVRPAPRLFSGLLGLRWKSGELGETTVGGQERAPWMHIRLEVNCQLTRFPNHMFPLKSRPPTDLIPRQQQGAKLPSSIPKGQRIPRTSARRVAIISASGIVNGLSHLCLGI